MKIGINGFGRIGRSVFRILNGLEGAKVVAINDKADNEALAYLLRNDTVMGQYPDRVAFAGRPRSSNTWPRAPGKWS